MTDMREAIEQALKDALSDGNGFLRIERIDPEKVAIRLDSPSPLLARMAEGLRPFAEFGKDNTDADGWAGLGCDRERIRVWFGPSDFRTARALLDEYEGSKTDA